jgi:LmbE family N-acetylglucosaminyl deacetylase
MSKGRILCILAHPDDETFGPGGTIAKYADLGYETFLATATKGEAGMLGDPPIATRENVGDVRASELECAARTLGIKEVFFMGFIDGKLVETPMGSIIERAVYAVRKFRPHVIISFGPDGVSGHPDHVKISEVSNLSFRKSADPKFCTHHRENGNLHPWQAMKLYHFEIPEKFLKERNINLSGVPMEDITTVIDTSEYVERKIEAFNCHKTQIKDSNRILSRPNYREFTRKEYYVLADVAGVETTTFPEIDLFQGIDSYE